MEERTVSGWLVFGAVALLTAAGVGLIRFHGQKPAAAAVEHPIMQAPARPPSLFQLGEIVAVKRACGVLGLAVSPVAATARERYYAAGDQEGLSELVDADLVYPIRAEGSVRIIGFDANPEVTRRLGSETSWIQVRVASGEKEGRAGWVDASCLTR